MAARPSVIGVKYWKIIADNLKKSRLEFGLRFNAGRERANDVDC